MKYHVLRNGTKMPALGLGTWKSAPNDVYHAVKSAVMNGYRHIDCAAIYNNEAEVGKALAELMAEGVVKREELFITSKLWNNAHAEADVFPALKKTLSDLQLDYLDLYLIHWPVAFKKEVVFPSDDNGFISLEELPITTTWKGMEQALELGLTKEIGVSNFSQKKLKHLVENAHHKPSVNQIELHPYLAQNDMLALANELGVVLTAYSPLGSFDRSAEMKADNEPVLLKDPTVMKIAENHGLNTGQVLLAWAVQRGTVAIPKSVNPERQKGNLKAALVNLSDDEMDLIHDLDRHYRYVKADFFAHGTYTIENIWDGEASKE